MEKLPSVTTKEGTPVSEDNNVEQSKESAEQNAQQDDVKTPSL
jgi:hypothetical protein